MPAPPTEAAGSQGLTAASVLELQRTAGNVALQRMLDNGPPVRRGAAGPTIQRAVEKIGEEEVEVANDEEKKEAADIIKELKDKYGVDVSSKTTVEGIKAQYTNVPETVLNSVKTRKWRMIELRALRDALKHYAPILGADRAKSTRKDAGQEVTSVGKVDQAIDKNIATGQLDTTTLGEYFSGKKNMGLFKASENYKADFPDEKDQLVGTFVHEIAHGLLAYALDDYITATGFWTDRNRKSGTAGAEAPTTSYGEVSAAEDLCESAMMFFVKPSRLKDGDGSAAGTSGNACPKRYAFMEKIGKDWMPPIQAVPQVVPAAATSTSTPTATPTAVGAAGK